MIPFTSQVETTTTAQAPIARTIAGLRDEVVAEVVSRSLPLGDRRTTSTASSTHTRVAPTVTRADAGGTVH